MPTPHNILVALDFSPHSDAAITDAFELAARFDAKVHLLHVYSLQDEREPAPFSGTELEEARLVEKGRLESSANAHRNSGHLGEVFWHDGDPASQIVLTAKQHSIDLIVIGASGRTGMSRLILGSVTASVVKNANCNVLVVRGSVE